jgi:hypothetical protein
MNDPMMEIALIAPSLNVLKFDKDAEVHIDVLNETLIWAGEQPFNLPGDGEMFHYLLSYRTSLIEGAPIVALQPYWEAARRAFPNWPGFAPSRCEPSESLTVRLELKRREARRCLEEWLGR